MLLTQCAQASAETSAGPASRCAPFSTAALCPRASTGLPTRLTLAAGAAHRVRRRCRCAGSRCPLLQAEDPLAGTWDITCTIHELGHNFGSVSGVRGACLPRRLPPARARALARAPSAPRRASCPPRTPAVAVPHTRLLRPGRQPRHRRQLLCHGIGLRPERHHLHERSVRQAAHVQRRALLCVQRRWPRHNHELLVRRVGPPGEAGSRLPLQAGPHRMLRRPRLNAAAATSWRAATPTSR